VDVAPSAFGVGLVHDDTPLPRYSAVVSNGVKHNTELARKSKTLAHRSKFTSATPLTSGRPTKRVGQLSPDSLLRYLSGNPPQQ
jgi:hypothetical protein